ncbi:ABC transporter ATP-binding protein [Bordetella muralis]|uniref:ABC transporter ATP-binding protein n=1 Tax=Bordetella muralis TaxID=1649130 RepID=UPI0039EE371E
MNATMSATTPSPTPAMSTAAPPALLQLQGLSKRFGGLQAITDVSMDLPAGLITTLVGPNGAGKTTLFNMITGHLTPSAGTVYLHGKPLSKLAPWQIARLGVGRTFQDLRLFTHMSVMENVTTVTERGSWLWQRRTDPQRIESILNEAGLWNQRHERAADLAYAERKFLSLARLMASGASLWLLDEPASGLDPRSFDRFVALLRDYATRGITICIIEHNLDLVTQLSDQLAFLDQGKLLACGDPAAILQDPALAAIYFGERA